MRTTITAFALLLAALGPAAAQDPPPVPVYLVQPEASFTDAALQARIDSTKDLRGLRWDKKLVRFVESPEQAAVVLEVTGRSAGADAATQKTSRDAVTGQIQTDAQKINTVTVKLTVGDYSTDIVGRDEGNSIMGPTWSSAAIKAFQEIQKWIKTNRAKLPVK